MVLISIHKKYLKPSWCNFVKKEGTTHCEFISNITLDSISALLICIHWPPGDIMYK